MTDNERNRVISYKQRVGGSNPSAPTQKPITPAFPPGFFIVMVSFLLESVDVPHPWIEICTVFLYHVRP